MTRLKLGTAPDSWGVWYAQDPHQTPWQRCLDEVAQAGYAWLELGPYGYLPNEPKVLAEELARRNLKVAGGTVHGVGGLERADQWQAALDISRKVAELTSKLGGRDLVFVPGPGYRDETTGAYLEPAELDTNAWGVMVHNMDALGKIIVDEYGVRLDFHPHADSHVETPAQVERFLDDTDPRYTSICLDTGHVAYRAGDSVELIRKYPDRIGYVHIKQVDPRLAKLANEQDLAFSEAVKRGVCVEPPHGEPDIPDIIDTLNRLNRDLFVVVEQDLYPCAFDIPLPIAVRTAAYLRDCGL